MEIITTGTEMKLVIALGVVSGFAFLVLIVTLSLMFFIRRKSRKSTKDTDKGETFNSGVNEIFLRGGKLNFVVCLPCALQDTVKSVVTNEFTTTPISLNSQKSNIEKCNKYKTSESFSDELKSDLVEFSALLFCVFFVCLLLVVCLHFLKRYIPSGFGCLNLYPRLLTKIRKG